jgi:hypothetical protein
MKHRCLRLPEGGAMLEERIKEGARPACTRVPEKRWSVQPKGCGFAVKKGAPACLYQSSQKP